MTTTFNGIESPFAPAGRVLPIPPVRSAAYTFQQPPRSWPRQTLQTKSSTSGKETPRDAQEPPSKKPKLEDTGDLQINTLALEGNLKSTSINHATSVDDGPSLEESEKSSRAQSRLSFPLRPGGCKMSGTTQLGRPLAIERAGRKDAVLIKAYSPEPPSCASRYHEAGSADFFPWTGHHPEDVLNELTTKQGFYDRIQASQNESSTARPSVWSSLKHKSGLQILSSLFISALDQRQIHGTVTATSTFKPPPRVTLTDTKREAWLRDLANPSIPLRRLSRTIPHGIRGRILLDHCLSKDIPTSRAVWLAKCVGANEIRAFKRKGTGGVFTVGGETKWIKDWTSSIEQFLESLIASCGSLDWKIKIDYGLRLACHLYAEQLVDKDHYLKWLILSIEGSDLDHLPAWLLIQRIHQQEILQQRQQGRRLARAILRHMYIANSSLACQELYGPVMRQLIQLSKFIMTAAPACLLLPGTWDKYKSTLWDCAISQESSDLQRCFENLAMRNARIRIDSSQLIQSHNNVIAERLITTLDSLSGKPDYSIVAERCLQITKDIDMLVGTCVEWSCSPYRYGLFRTYAAARMLRIWHRHGIELQKALLNILASNGKQRNFIRRDLYKLFADLVSSRHFLVGRYLQWLMARGTLRDARSDDTEFPLDVGLLFELPLQGLPPHVLNLRQTLISSLKEVTLGEEARLIKSAKIGVSKQNPRLFHPIAYVNEQMHQPLEFTHLSQTVKSDIARWIQQNIVKRVLECSIDLRECKEHSEELRSLSSEIMSLQDFFQMRRLLEDLRDFSIFADILDLIADRTHGPVLTAVADVINFHFQIFNAIGAANDIFGKLVDNIMADQSQDLESASLESLIDLGCRLSLKDPGVQGLRSKMVAHAPKLPVSACSPISDTMVEAVQSTQPTFADEMDQMLASGTSMDRQTLARVFETLVDHLLKSFNESIPLGARFSQLLATLRGFGSRDFDGLINDWLFNWLQKDPSKGRSVLLESLICSGAISLDVVLSVVLRVMEQASSQGSRANTALIALELIIEARSGRIATIEYRRYRIQDQLLQMLQQNPMAILAVIREAATTCQMTDSTTCTTIELGTMNDAVADLMQLILLYQFESPEHSEPAASLSHPVHELLAALTAMLPLGEPSISSMKNLRQEIIRVLSGINSFGVTMLKLRLKAVLSATTTSPQDSADALSEIMVEQAISVGEDDVELWASLLPELSVSLVSSIRDLAESKALAWAINDTSLSLTENSHHILNLLPIVRASALSMPAVETSDSVERITEKLMSIVFADDSEIHRQIESDYLSQRIDVLLCLLVLHQSTIQNSRCSASVQLNLFVALSLLLVDPRLNTHPSLCIYNFDVLCLLTDSISDDMRLRCLHVLRDNYHMRDSRLDFFFGDSESGDSEWLQLVTKSSPAGEIRLGGSSAAANTTLRPYPLRRWEMMQDATPMAAENDTSLSLTLFGSRKSIL
ncbi:RNA polymerase II mediator complex subunit [Lecanora helva]